jgi:hypothetical protein
MSSNFTCIGPGLNVCYPMRTRSKMLTAGVRCRAPDRNSGRLSASGYGTCARN